MLTVALLLSAAATPEPAQTYRPPIAEVRATVRIVRGTEVKLGHEAPEAELRRTEFRDRDGSVQPARFTEFQ